MPFVQMAGLPAAVVHRAAAVATDLQQQNEQASGVLSQHGITSQNGPTGQGAAAAGEHAGPGRSTPPAAALGADAQQRQQLGTQDQQQLLEVVRCLLQLRKEPTVAPGGCAAAGSQRLQELWAHARQI